MDFCQINCSDLAKKLFLHINFQQNLSVSFWTFEQKFGFCHSVLLSATFLCLGQQPYLLCIFKYFFKTSLLSNLHRVSRLYHNGLMWKWENHHEIIIFLGMLSTHGGCSLRSTAKRQKFGEIARDLAWNTHVKSWVMNRYGKNCGTS